MRHPAFVLLTLAALTSLTARPSAAQSVRGFGEGYTDLGPVVGLGNLGDAGLAFGARFERAIKRVPSLADGVIGIEIGVNYYHYSASFAGTGYGFTYVPIGVTANYHVKTSDKRFDPFVGAGLGYSAAVAARLAEAVIGLEENPEFAAEAERALAETGADNVAVVEGTLANGAPRHGPYDVILVEGAVANVPAALTDQLKDGGRIVAIFADGALGTVRVGYRIDEAISWRFAFNAGAPVLPGFEASREFVL